MDAASNEILTRSLALSADLLTRAEPDTDNSTSESGKDETSGRPPIYKTVGIILAVCSGLFIGVSFVVKKVGLLKANVKYNEEAGEGYGYLKNWWWWLGMTLMIIGEICNFVAYAFADAILVTPLGALSVVVTTILSAIFLKERLSFVGKVGCFMCIIGSVVIAVNAPEQAAVSNIQDMQHYVIAPGFLSYAGVIIVGSIAVAWFVAPKYGKKSMLVYLTICSLVGGLSVVATQGLGAAVLAAINGQDQFTKWFLYVLFVFVIATLLTEIIYLNKALNIFNAALVTPTYYVYFTSSTIVASAVLFQGFHGTAMQIVDVVMGFLVICSGVVLLQLAKSSKDVPDTAVFKGDLDQVRTVAEQEEPEYEPRADTIRGGAGIVRAMSRVRTQRQAEEAKRIHEERMMPIGEDEQYEWDGLRRRRTVSTAASGSIKRANTKHPPLGMTKFPDVDDDEISNPDSEVHPGFFGRIGRKSRRSTNRTGRSGHSPVPLRNVSPDKVDQDDEHHYTAAPTLNVGHDGEMDTAYTGAGGDGHIHFAGDQSRDRATSQASGGLAPPKPPPHSANASTTAGPAKRQFSFHNVFGLRQRGDSVDSRPVSRGALSFVSRASSRGNASEYPGQKQATEEERLGLVHGDSERTLPRYDEVPEERESGDGGRSSDDWQVTSGTSSSPEQLGLSGDLGGARRGRDPYGGERFDDDDDDVMYDEPLQSPPERFSGYQGGGSGHSGGSGRPAFM